MAERPPQHGGAPGRRTVPRMAPSDRRERTLGVPFSPDPAASCGEGFSSGVSMPPAPRRRNEEDLEGGPS